MPKSHRRKLKKPKASQVDASGKPFKARNLKINRDINRRIMYRNIMFSNAAESLSAAEIKALIKQARDRQCSTEAKKQPTISMSYIETKLDKDNIPIEAGTKTILISGDSDINRLETVLKHKEDAEIKLSQEVKSQSKLKQ